MCRQVRFLLSLFGNIEIRSVVGHAWNYSTDDVILFYPVAFEGKIVTDLQTVPGSEQL